MNKTPYCKKIMIVDDNEIDRYIAQMNVEGEEFAAEVVLQESVKSALEYLKLHEATPEELPSLIFLDIRMPDIDGFGFLDAYKNLPEAIRRKSIIMMLSSSLNEDDHRRAESNEYVKRFVTKPLDKQKLNEIRTTGITLMKDAA